jgi:hypothetical protein
LETDLAAIEAPDLLDALKRTVITSQWLAVMRELAGGQRALLADQARPARC